MLTGAASPLPPPPPPPLRSLTAARRPLLALLPDRWLGHGTLWVVTFHALAYYIYWGVSDTAGG